MPLPLLKMVLKVLFLRNGITLEDFVKIGTFYLYKVAGVYLPSETLGWHLTFKAYLNSFYSVGAYGYKPKEGDTVIDIGAGIGEEVIVLSKLVGPKGKVYAIEANPEVFAVLSKVKELNGLHNVILFNLAVAEDKGVVTLQQDSASFLSGNLKASQSGGRSFEVDGIILDEWMVENNIQHVDFLKVNIEGAERFLIESLKSQIIHVDHVAISCHDFRYKNEGNEFFKTKGIIKAFLVSKNFSLQEQNTGIGYVDDWVYGSVSYEDGKPAHIAFS